MPRLITITFREPPGLPGVRTGQLSTIDVGQGFFATWTIQVRGPTIAFVSPAGWKRSPEATPTNGRRVYEVPRSHASLQWEYAEGEEVEPVKEWTSGAAPVVVVAVPPVAPLVERDNDPDEPSVIRRAVRR